MGTGAAPSISSHRYSPYQIPSLNAAGAVSGAGQLGAAAAGQLGAAAGAGGVQYTVASPLMSQLSAASAVLPTSAPSQQQQQQQQHLDVAAGVPSHVTPSAQGKLMKRKTSFATPSNSFITLSSSERVKLQYYFKTIF